MSVPLRKTGSLNRAELNRMERKETQTTSFFFEEIERGMVLDRG